jgi:hypothetical protein
MAVVDASFVSQDSATKNLPESAQSTASVAEPAEPAEPRYLEELWEATLDKSLSARERKAHEAKYFDLYTRWKCLQARLAVATSNLSRSQFWKSLSAALDDHWEHGEHGPLEKVEEVVCLCLGRLEDNASIHQLSLLVLLLGRLGIRHENCSIFDPCHSPADTDILKHFGFNVLSVNDQARIRVNCMTMFYMPFGDYHLTNNLLETNWSSLHLVSILGNDLAWVCDENAEPFDAAQQDGVKSRAPHAQKVAKLVKETHLVDTYASQVRMDLANLLPKASQTFGAGLVDSLDCTLTTFPPKIQLQDVACQEIEWLSKI